MLNSYSQHKKWEYIRGGYFIPGTNKQWIEFNQNGKPRFTYNVIDENDTTLTLYDENRKLYVRLTDAEMYFGNQKDSINKPSFFGMWKPNPFKIKIAKGTNLWMYEKRGSYFAPLDGQKWVEIDRKKGFTMYHYVLLDGAENSTVILYDASRNLYVKLTPAEMFFGNSRDDITKASLFGTWEKK